MAVRHHLHLVGTAYTVTAACTVDAGIEVEVAEQAVAVLAVVVLLQAFPCYQQISQL